MFASRRLLAVLGAGALLCSCKGAAGPTATLLAAGEDLPEGAEVVASQMTLVQVSRSLATENSIAPDQVQKTAGKRLRVPLKRGDLLLASYFQVSDEKISNLVMKKGRAVTLSVSGAENLHAGDRVDLLSAVPDPQSKEWMAVTQAQNVVVLSPGEAVQATGGEAFPLRRVTFLLLPEEAEVGLLAARVGGLHVSLRNPDDIDVQVDRGRATVSTILSGERAQALETLRRRFLNRSPLGGVMRSTNHPNAAPAQGAPEPPAPPAPHPLALPTGASAAVPADTAPVPVMPGKQQ